MVSPRSVCNHKHTILTMATLQNAQGGAGSIQHFHNPILDRNKGDNRDAIGVRTLMMMTSLFFFRREKTKEEEKESKTVFGTFGFANDRSA